MLSERQDLTISDIAAKLDICTKEVRQANAIGRGIIDAIADLKATFTRVAQENPTQQNR